jgi:microcystin-dependent protein
MAEPYLGEIRMFAGNYAPDGWALCNGEMLSIVDYDALYSLVGTTYGGDGQTTFGLPDLQGRIPIHPNSNSVLAAKGGDETITLTVSELPSHSHPPRASSQPGNQQSPSGTLWAKSSVTSYLEGPGTPVMMNSQLISQAGGNMPHDNMMPSLTISFIIALQGIYPQQS